MKSSLNKLKRSQEREIRCDVYGLWSGRVVPYDVDTYIVLNLSLGPPNSSSSSSSMGGVACSQATKPIGPFRNPL